MVNGFMRECHEEWKTGQIPTLNYLSGFVWQLQRSCSLISLSQLRVWFETPFRSSPQNGGRNFPPTLHRLWLVFNSYLYLVASPSQLTFKLEPSPYSHLVLEGGSYPFSVVTHSQKIWDNRFFLVISNYWGHLPMTGWHTTCALAWLLRSQLAVP